MKGITNTLLLVCVLAILSACERPQSPDFTLQQNVQAPINIENTFQFLGENDALIDTTSDDFDSLFTVEGNGLISLSRQEDFDFSSLDGAIPTIDVSATGISSEVGEIELGDLTSGSSSNVGSASFQNITGFNPAAFPQGTTIPGVNPSPSTEITLNTDFFVSAILKQNGSLQLTVTNNLGFNIDQLNITLQAGSTTLGSTIITPFNDGATENGTINLSAGDNLNNLNIDVEASWQTQQMQRDPDNLVVNDVSGNNLVGSQVTAVVPSQDISSSGLSNVDDSEFQFTNASHFVELQSGQLRIVDLINQIPLDIENVQISFPDIRTAPNYAAADSLVITTTIPRAIGGMPGRGQNQTVDLSGVRIFAQGNTIDYNITGTTENTQQGPGSSSRTITELDSFTASVEITDLNIKRAEGIITPRNVLVNNDEPGNGVDVVDLFNDDEAETVDISELNDISEQLTGLEFANPKLSILYATNLGVDAAIIGAILGIDPNGNEVYLTGKQGQPNFVSTAEIPSELRSNGSLLSSNQLIKFDLSTSANGSMVMGSSVFDTMNTNVAEFLNILPTSIRFVGVAKLNENGTQGIIQDPVRFDPSLSLDLPLQFSSSSSTFSDTTKVNLENIPGADNDKRKLSDGVLTVNYTNNLPFRLNLSLIMLDQLKDVVTEVPLPNEDELVLGAASVDANTRFVTNGNEGKVSFLLNEQQLSVLNRTRELVVRITFNTTNNEEVKVRAEDSITLSIKLSVKVESEIN